MGGSLQYVVRRWWCQGAGGRVPELGPSVFVTSCRLLSCPVGVAESPGGQRGSCHSPARGQGEGEGVRGVRGRQLAWLHRPGGKRRGESEGNRGICLCVIVDRNLKSQSPDVALLPKAQYCGVVVEAHGWMGVRGCRAMRLESEQP